ncbi:MAG: hypothetical protein DKT66_25455 [Candidatus Melainabacteria bacterium]|nr:MAG: hypothetical protein DKT66_25455 [Candidatus Melainabacteria bacterium]
MSSKADWSVWKELAVVSAIYCALLAYLVSPFWLNNQSLYIADVTYNFVPAGRYIEQIFRESGGFTVMKPMWNPFLLCGAPEVSVAWPLAYLPGYAACLFNSAQGQAFLIFFHLFVAGLGGYVWFWKQDDRSSLDSNLAQRSTPLVNAITSPAALFGFMFMLCGYMVGSSINLSLMFSVCWTPLALYLIDRLAISRTSFLPLTGLLALVLAQQFGAGRPEMFLGECVLYACYALLKIAEHAPDERQRSVAGRFIGGLIVALVLSLLFNSANILPMIEAVKNSPRLPKFDPSDGLNWSAGWFEFLGIILMQPLGQLNMAHYSLYPTYPNSMAYVTSLFLGAPVLVLAFFGTGDSSWKQKGFWLWMIFIFTLVSLGEFIPIWRPIYEAIPSVNLLRFPVKMTVFVELAIIALAARGWSSVIRGSVTRSDFNGGAVFWGVLLVIGFTVLASMLLGNMQPLSVVMAMSSGCDDLNMAKEAALKLSAHATIAGLTGFATCIALANLKGRYEGLIRFCLVSLIVSSLVINGTKQLWHTVDASFFDDKANVLSLVKTVPSPSSSSSSSPSPSPSNNFKVLSLFRHPIAVPGKVLEAPEATMERDFMAYARYILAPNTNIDRRIPMLSGMSVLPDWATVFMETGILPRSMIRAELTHEAGKSDVPLYKWCQATATKYILCPINMQSEEDLNVREAKGLDPHYFKVAAEDKHLNVRIYEVSPIRNRVQLFSRATKAESRIDALRTINRSDTERYDPLSECILCEPDAASLLSFEAKRPALDEDLLNEVLNGQIVNRPGSADIKADSHENVVVEVDAAVPSVLVFADSYYSGWTVTDNGEPAHLLIADGLMKSVLLKPGKHQVVFQFTPKAYLYGLYIGACTLAVIFVLIFPALVIGNLKRRRQRAIIQS